MQNIYSHTDFDIVCQIRNNFDTMSKSYKKIAVYLMKNQNALNGHTITTLSRKIGSTPSTITRFCQSLNFSGFPEFKFCMEKGILNMELPDEKINPFDTMTSIRRKLHRKYTKAIEETIALFSERDLKRAADLIKSAEKVVFFAHGSSVAISTIAQVSFMQIGIPCLCISDSLMSSLVAEQLTEKDVAIGISNSGNAKITVDALKRVKKNNVTTIGITGQPNSLLVNYSDIKLCYKATDDLRYNHICEVSKIVIIGTLFTYILSNDYEKRKENMQRSKMATLSDSYDYRKN